MTKITQQEINNWQLPEFEIKEFVSKKTDYCICIPVINEGEKLKKLRKYGLQIHVIRVKKENK